MSTALRGSSAPYALSLLALALAVAPPARADEETPRPPEVEGGKDHAKIPRYPGAILEKRSHKEFDEYDFPHKVAGGELEKTKVSGETFTFTYDNPRKTSAAQVSKNYENALRAAGFDVVVSLGDSDERHLSAIHPQGGKIWFYLHSYLVNDANKSDIVVVEGKALEQKLAIDVGALQAALAKDGRVAVPGIHFETGSAKLRDESSKVLEQVLKLLEGDKALRLRIEGHTDSVGGEKANLVLSKKRASSVRAWLVSKGVDEERLEIAGLGQAKPVASNGSEEGRAQNRRVELVKLAAGK